MKLANLSLDGRYVRLEPLDERHAADLLVVGRDESVWQWLTRDPFRDEADVRGWIAEATAGATAGTQFPFAIIDKAAGRVVGSTRYLDIRPADRSVEIGWTWLAVSAQRTAINTECKFLLLRHAFETLGMTRVQLKTDARNIRSQRAIERIGAVREGVLRKYQATRRGHIRDTVMYSVTREEWDGVKAALLAKMG